MIKCSLTTASFLFSFGWDRALIDFINERLFLSLERKRVIW